MITSTAKREAINDGRMMETLYVTTYCTLKQLSIIRRSSYKTEVDEANVHIIISCFLVSHKKMLSWSSFTL
jgi:hypothetical protein